MQRLTREGLRGTPEVIVFVKATVIAVSWLAVNQSVSFPRNLLQGTLVYFSPSWILEQLQARQDQSNFGVQTSSGTYPSFAHALYYGYQTVLGLRTHRSLRVSVQACVLHHESSNHEPTSARHT